MNTGVLRRDFGRLSDGRVVEVVRLSGNGIAAEILTYGAAIRSIEVPDEAGIVDDICLGYDHPDFYETGSDYLGAVIGRYANRISNARFNLDGATYVLEANEGPNCLHGGPSGFSHWIWEVECLEEAPVPTVVLRHISPHGEGGFPGRVEVRARYALTGPGELSMTLTAETDRPTVLSLTNHVYFNLAGAAANADVLGHRLTVDAEMFLEIDRAMIPTGRVQRVEGTPFDFRGGRAFSEMIRDGHDRQIAAGRGYDHCFVFRGGASASLRRVARVHEPGSGRILELLTTEPGLQVYSGNFLDATSVGKGGRVIRQSDGFCLEPQRYPDAPNRPVFPSARLDPGETYRHETIYRFFTSATHSERTEPRWTA